jgi:acylphosphatase
VQGVGFRWFVRREASRLGIDGWCRNLPDGTVEVEAAGERQSIESLVGQLNRGPSSAQVTDVAVTWQDAGVFSLFEIR